MPKQRSLQPPGCHQVLQVQWLFTVTPRHQNTLQLFSEDFAENLHGVTQRKDSLLRIQLHHSLLPPKLQASHLISQAQLFHHQRVRKCHLTGLSERWNETIQERVLVNRCHLQSKLQKDVHKKKKKGGTVLELYKMNEASFCYIEIQIIKDIFLLTFHIS